jgi:hypothetical protein
MFHKIMRHKFPVLFAATALIGAQVMAQAGPLVVEDGTPVRLRTSQTISSADAHVDDRVDFEVVDDVKVGDTVLIRHGTTAIGTVTEAQPKRRMGKGGKLNVNIDSTKAITGDKVALRGVKQQTGGGHTGAMTGAMVGTAIVFWPAAPFFLFMHGKDITVPKGHEFTVYTSGAVRLDQNKVASSSAVPNGTAAASGTNVASAAGSGATLSVTSIPLGAEIDVDGAFVGSTPSSVSVTPGDHKISVKKSGYEGWERKIHVTGGNVNVAAELSRSPKQ